MAKLSSLETDSPATVAAGAALWAKGFKNELINGCFRLWWRGISLPAATGVRYLADRWFTSATGSTAAPSLQQFAFGQTVVPGSPRYFHRVVVSSVAGASNSVSLSQFIEDVERFSGRSVMVSFWAKADAARSIAVEMVQSFGGGGSPSAPVLGIGATKIALTTSWAKYAVPVTLPSVAGKILGTYDDATALNFWMDAGSALNSRTGSLGQQSGTFDFACVQLETGRVDTAFERRPIGLEYQMALRYALLIKAAVPYQFFANGYVANSTQTNNFFSLPAPMRKQPAVSFGGPLSVVSNGVFSPVSTLTVQATANTNGVTATIGSGSLTPNVPSILASNNSTDTYVLFDAEF